MNTRPTSNQGLVGSRETQLSCPDTPCRFQRERSGTASQRPDPRSLIPAVNTPVLCWYTQRREERWESGSASEPATPTVPCRCLSTSAALIDGFDAHLSCLHLPGVGVVRLVRMSPSRTGTLEERTLQPGSHISKAWTRFRSEGLTAIAHAQRIHLQLVLSAINPPMIGPGTLLARMDQVFTIQSQSPKVGPCGRLVSNQQIED